MIAIDGRQDVERLGHVPGDDVLLEDHLGPVGQRLEDSGERRIARTRSRPGWARPGPATRRRSCAPARIRYATAPCVTPTTIRILSTIPHHRSSMRTILTALPCNRLQIKSRLSLTTSAATGPAGRRPPWSSTHRDRAVAHRRVPGVDDRPDGSPFGSPASLEGHAQRRAARPTRPRRTPGRRRPASASTSRRLRSGRPAGSAGSRRCRGPAAAVARRQAGAGVLEPAVGVDVAAGLLGERRPGQHHVGQLGQRRSPDVLDDQEARPSSRSCRRSPARR